MGQEDVVFLHLLLGGCESKGKFHLSYDANTNWQKEYSQLKSQPEDQSDL